MQTGPNIPVSVSTLAVAFLLATAGAASAATQKQMPLPDPTKGEPIPAGATHDWNLGATGARGWIDCDKRVTTAAGQIAIPKVEKGSPAADVLAVGDVLPGVDGKAFSHDSRTELGQALTTAYPKPAAEI